MQWSEITLDNGLRVIHHYDPASSMVAMNVLYNVGSRDDSPHLTGMAHLFEHLMFGGSVNIPDFDRSLELAGGSNNAWTNDDFTSFWDMTPAANAETIFWLESDRMLSPAFSDKALEVQRNVVVEEFKQVCLNRPYGDVSHHQRAMIFPEGHPYRYPTIGKEPAHIERVTQADVRSFFFSHYAPNNAVAAVAGNITAERTRELAEKWFSPIPRRDIAPRQTAERPRPTAPKRMEVEADVPLPLLSIAFPMGGYFSEHYIGADLLTDILAAGKASRLYRRLMIDSELFTSADASISGTIDCGYLMFNAMLSNAGAAHRDEAEAMLSEQIELCRNEAPTEAELQRVLNQYESRQLFGQLTILSKVNTMAQDAILGKEPSERLKEYLATTTDDIHRAALDILRPDSAQTLIYG